MNRALLCGVVAALALPAGAAAHGTIRPNLVPPGATREFTILIPNARDVAIVGVDVTVPPGATLLGAASGGGWKASTSGPTVAWRGGAIRPRGFDSFALRARMPASSGSVRFTGREVYADLTGPPFPLDVVLASGAQAGQPAASDDGTRTLAIAALVVALVALVLAAGALLLSLARWLKG